MEKVVTATGKTFDCDYLVHLDSLAQIYVRVLGVTMATAVETFSNSAETIQLWYGNLYYSGYTKVIAVIPESDAVKIILARK